MMMESLEHAARRLAKAPLSQGFQPLALHRYTDSKGNLLYARVRLKNPKTGEKWIRPIHQKGDRYILGEPEFSQGKPLYRSLDILKKPEANVWLVEGELCADALTDLGLLATTSGAANSAVSTDWHPLARRSVFVWRDNDTAGLRYAQQATQCLQDLGCKVQWIDVTRLDLPEKGDVVDWLRANPQVTKSDVEALPLLNPSSSIACESDQWPEPCPIRSELFPVESLPLSAIPEAYQDWMEDSAHRMQCPIDFIAVAAVVMTGAIIGAGCGIKPKRLDDWLVIPNLWGGAVGRPSMLKTPSLNEALRPLARLEAQAKESFDVEKREYEVALEVYKAQKEALKPKKGKDFSPDEYRQGLLQMKEPKKPVWKRYKTNDASIEKMGELLAENPRGMLVFRDELVGLLSSWDREGHEPDRAFYLEAWNGCGNITTDRIGRGTIHVENLCVSVFGGIQPAKLLSYLHQATSGMGNDGLIQRLQLMIYPDERGGQIVDEHPNNAAKHRACVVLEKLVKMDFTQYGAILEEGQHIPYFRFSEQAQELFFEWLTELEREKLRQEQEPIILEHLGKYRSLMPSLALIFHLIDISDGKATGMVTLSAAEKAAAWCDYLESHARRIYGMVMDIASQGAAKLLKKIKAGEIKDGFSTREIYRKEWGLLNSSKSVDQACEELIESGWIKVEVIPGRQGQRSKKLYRLHPNLMRAYG